MSPTTTRKRRYHVKDANHLAFLTPTERAEIDAIPLPPELQETCYYIVVPGHADTDNQEQ